MEAWCYFKQRGNRWRNFFNSTNKLLLEIARLYSERPPL